MAAVLVIDDEPGMRRLMARILADAGFEVIEASDGAEGIRLFRERRPQIVVTDILMPQKEGLETISELRRLAPATRIIAVSGGGEMQMIMFLDFARDLGADAVLAKPFKPAELLALVQAQSGAA